MHTNRINDALKPYATRGPRDSETLTHTGRVVGLWLLGLTVKLVFTDSKHCLVLPHQHKRHLIRRSDSLHTPQKPNGIHMNDFSFVYLGLFGWGQHT